MGATGMLCSSQVMAAPALALLPSPDKQSFLAATWNELSSRKWEWKPQNLLFWGQECLFLAINQRKQISFEYPGLDIKTVHLPGKTVDFATTVKDDLWRTCIRLYTNVAFSHLTAVCTVCATVKAKKNPWMLYYRTSKGSEAQRSHHKDFCWLCLPLSRVLYAEYLITCGLQLAFADTVSYTVWNKYALEKDLPVILWNFLCLSVRAAVL